MNRDQKIHSEPSCMDDYDPNSRSIEDAERLILEQTTAVDGIETAELKDALERILAADAKSKIDVPGHDNSAMDGYAVKSSDLPKQGFTSLKQIGKALAGHPFTGTVNRGECVRIMTGAPIPAGCDTVVIQERTETSGNAIRIDADNKSGQNVRCAGEDIKAGHTVLTEGKRLLASELGLLSSCGITRVAVKRRPRIAFFSTGDELTPSGAPLEPGQIYDSNRYTLFGMLKRTGVEIIDLGIVPDTRKAIGNAFQEASRQADAIITSGGVSVGEADFVRDILGALGKVHFWKVAIKPGRPLAFGHVGNALYFGLPGNPVSVMVTYYVLVQPALRKLMGAIPEASFRIQARCTDALRKRKGRVEYQRGFLKPDQNGGYQVHKTGAQGSGILSSMSAANCFIVLPTESEAVNPGTVVETIPFQGLV